MPHSPEKEEKRKNYIFGRPVTEVSEIPYYAPGVKIPKEDVIKYGLDSVYRLMFARGQGASRTDKTWDRVTHVHTCCGCRYPWRHFAHCKNALRNCPDDLSDLKDIS